MDLTAQRRESEKVNLVFYERHSRWNLLHRHQKTNLTKWLLG